MAALVTQELLTDLALLSALSVLVHYCFGLLGVAAAVVIATLLEHGVDLANALLDRGARYATLQGELAGKAANAVAAIRRRRTTKTAQRTGDGFFAARRDHALHHLNDDVGECDELDDGNSDPRALLERFADDNVTVDNDAAYDTVTTLEQQQQQRAQSDVASEESAASSEDAASHLVIRDISNHASSSTAASSRHRRQQSLPSPTPSPPQTSSDRFIPMNARAPVAFETDLFAGHVHFFVRTTPEDPHWTHLFRSRRRMFWIQVQGAFKRAPRGTVYLGGELPDEIAPGLFTRSVALVIMGLIQQLIGNVNYSFGDAQRDVRPSIALPLYQSADQLVVTPAGETPPRMGERDFGESEAARRIRRATPVGAETYVVDATYSFDFHTMYVDLTRWRTTNLPGVREMALSTFFDALPLHMVAYDIVASPSERHCQALKQYLFQFEVTHSQRDRRASQATTPLARTESSQSEDTASVTGVASTNGGDSAGALSTVVSDTSSFDDQILAFDDAVWLEHERARRFAALALSYVCWLEEVDVATGVRRVQYVFAIRETSADEEEEEGDAMERPSPQQLAVVSASALRTLLQTHYRRSAKHRASRRHHRRYDPNSVTTTSSDVLAPLASLRLHSQSRIGSYSTISDEAAVVAACLTALVAHQREAAARANSVTNTVDPSATEPLSRPDAVLDDTDNDDVAFHAQLYECVTQRSQLQRAACSPSTLGVNMSQRERDDMRVVCDGVVLRYYAHALVRQEVLVVTADELLFYRSYASRAEKRVACSHVLSVQALATFPGLATDSVVDAAACAFALQVQTLAEEIVLCVGTEHARSAWLRVLGQHCAVPSSAANDDAAPAKTVDALSSAAQVLQICSASSTPLKPASRVVLNACSLFPPRQAAPDEQHASLALVTHALKLALSLHARGCERVSVDETLAFLDAASALRTLDLRAAQRTLSHEALLALYLNLYHVVLAHAMLVHGFPRTSSQWAPFLTRMCYSVGLDSRTGEQLTLSLADLEHVVLRKRMAPAELPYLNVRALLVRDAKDNRSSSRSETPASATEQLRERQFAGLGVSHPDFRVLFALAMHQQHRRDGAADVVVFTPDAVHEQLNAVAQRALQHARGVAVEQRRSGEATILLPRICEWYRLDFAGGGSPLYCARKLVGFLDDATQHRVLDALDDPLATRIKFQDFAFAPLAALARLDVALAPRAIDAGVESAVESVESGRDTVVAIDREDNEALGRNLVEGVSSADSVEPEANSVDANDDDSVEHVMAPREDTSE